MIAKNIRKKNDKEEQEEQERGARVRGYPTPYTLGLYRFLTEPVK